MATPESITNSIQNLNLPNEESNIDTSRMLAQAFQIGYGSAEQIQHRLELVQFWGIKQGAQVLEIGCGQGECTIALAHAVGPDGHIDAVDPGAPDYGK